MKLITTTDVSDRVKRILYQFELEHDKFMDVMVVFYPEEPLIYCMQNEDGSYIYDNEKTYPNYDFNEEEILNYVKENLKMQPKK